VFVSWKDFYAGCCAHGEQIEIAADHRRQHRELAVETELPNPCCRLLACFGRRLATWGKWLDDKYSFGQYGSGGTLAK
jgi:hypothetical protein